MYGASLAVLTSGATNYGTFQWTPNVAQTMVQADIQFTQQAICTGTVTFGIYDYTTTTYTAFGNITSSVAHQTLTGSLALTPGDVYSLAADQAASSSCSQYPTITGIYWQYRMTALP
jgi:hypothetical protein